MKIVYKNKLEIKILAIAIGLLFGVIYLLITINDLIINNPAFWHNQSCLLLIAFVFSLPIIIVARYRIIFDFDKHTVTHRGFFTPEKTYRFSDLDVDYVVVSSIVSRFVFSLDEKVIFKLEELDFIKQTGESSDWLKELFGGEALEIYHIEKRLNSLDIIAYVTKYSFTPELTIFINNRNNSYGARLITAEYLFDEDSFLIHFEKMDTTPKNISGMKLVKELKLPHDPNLENKLAELSVWLLEDK